MKRMRTILTAAILVAAAILPAKDLGWPEAFAQEVSAESQKQEARDSATPPAEGQSSIQKAGEAAREAASATFGKVLPVLEKALALFDRQKDLPDKGLSYVPAIVGDRIAPSKHSYQKSIDELLDDAVALLKVSPVTDCRDKIEALKETIRTSTGNMDRYKKARVSAPVEKNDTLTDRWNPFHDTKESLDKKIAAEEAAIKDCGEQIAALKSAFGKGLVEMGMTVSDDLVESLLSTVGGGDFLEMGVVFDNLKNVSGCLRELTEKSGEAPEVSRQYYGIYLILAQVLDRTQTSYVKRVEGELIPQLDRLGEKAGANIRNAKQLIASNGGSIDTLKKNIESNELTIKAVNGCTALLKSNAEMVKKQNENTVRIVATAENTYQTVDVGANVGQLIATGTKEFDAIMNLKLPELRDFNNDALRKEYERLNLQITQMK